MPQNSPRPNLIPYRMKPEGDEALDRRQLQVKLPKSLREALDEIPSKQRSQLIREWIAEGFSRYQDQKDQERSDESERSELASASK